MNRKINVDIQLHIPNQALEGLAKNGCGDMFKLLRYSRDHYFHNMTCMSLASESFWNHVISNLLKRRKKSLRFTRTKGKGKEEERFSDVIEALENAVKGRSILAQIDSEFDKIRNVYNLKTILQCLKDLGFRYEAHQYGIDIVDWKLPKGDFNKKRLSSLYDYLVMYVFRAGGYEENDIINSTSLVIREYSIDRSFYVEERKLYKTVLNEQLQKRKMEVPDIFFRNETSFTLGELIRSGNFGADKTST